MQVMLIITKNMSLTNLNAEKYNLMEFWTGELTDVEENGDDDVGGFGEWRRVGDKWLGKASLVRCQGSIGKYAESFFYCIANDRDAQGGYSSSSAREPPALLRSKSAFVFLS